MLLGGERILQENNRVGEGLKNYLNNLTASPLYASPWSVNFQISNTKITKNTLKKFKKDVEIWIS